MSLVHYLTIGRFTYDKGAEPATLAERVVAHFIPDGLRRLERGIGCIQPFTDEELKRLEDELRRRFDLAVTLREHLTDQGLLCIRYTDVRVHLAEHVAVLAHELFGAVAGERGRLRSHASLQEASEQYAVQEAEQKRLCAIEDGVARVCEVVQALHRQADDPLHVPVWIGMEIVADVAAVALPDLIAALSAEHEPVRRFAALSLRRLGVAATEAVPALTAIVRDPESPDASAVVLALAAMGKAAEEALVLALDHRDGTVRRCAIEALGALGEVSDLARGRLVQLAVGKNGDEDAAREALSRLGHSP